MQQALSRADSLIPLYILDPHLLSQDAPSRKAFLFSSLRSLAEELAKLNCPLILRQGKPKEELTRIFRESGAKSITAEADYSPYALRRDRAAAARELPLTLTNGLTIHPARLGRQG